MERIGKIILPGTLAVLLCGIFDFGSGNSEMEEFLDIETFFKTALEEDLFVLIRPGPYICAEWEFGGLPSWILRTTSSVRTSNDANYMSLVKRYFRVLLPILAYYQFQKNGPVIGFQIENEYGWTGENDTEYLLQLKQMFIDNGIIELLFTSDSPSTDGQGAIPGVLQTANFNTYPQLELDRLKSFQIDKPIMTMEYWTGWYDTIGEGHNTVNSYIFKENLQGILDYPSSVNMYMFVGGTNFGFLNGATTFSYDTNNSGLQPITTSYDYDAPITEYGTYTDKYEVVKELITACNSVKTKTPNALEINSTRAYSTIDLENQMYFSTLVSKNYKSLLITNENIIPMELLPINNNSGQSYGYILYRKSNLSIPTNAVLKISGYVRDTVLVFINNILISDPPKTKSDIDKFGFWRLKDSKITLTTSRLENATLELLVENCGRNNFGNLLQFKQFKGLTEPVYINDDVLKNWEIVPIEFKRTNNNYLEGWLSKIKDRKMTSLYRGSLFIDEGPYDTFLDMREWKKGIVIINGFVLGRYFFLGPQQTLYIPAALLVIGTNNIIIFEHYAAASKIKFFDKPIYTNP